MTPALSEDRLLELALGGTPTPAEAQALADDPALARAVADLEDLFAVSLQPVAAPAGLRGRLLADTAEPWWRAVDAVSRLVDVGVDELRRVFARAREATWELWPDTGVHLFHFDGGAVTVGADVGLVRAAPGLVFPAHRHVGVERIVVIEGELEDEGRVLRVGDAADRPADSHHTWTAGPDGVVFAVVLFDGIELDAT